MEKEFDLKEEMLETVNGGISGTEGGAIEDCTNRGAVTDNADLNVGGICGYNDNEPLVRPGYGRPNATTRPG